MPEACHTTAVADEFHGLGGSEAIEDGSTQDTETDEGTTKMAITDVLASLPVAELETALGWYERLMGRPADDRPMAGLAEWHFPGTGDVQLVEDADRAGGGLVTLTVDDLHAHAAGMAERGIAMDPIDDTTSDVVLFVTVADPDGNAITLVEARPAPV